MSSVQSEVYEAFRTINVPEKEALAAAQALGLRDTDVMPLKGDLKVVQALLGVNSAMLVTILIRLFVH